jgi:nitrate/TMAO reductase-like tetraheme cytochrome c subunit
VAYVRQPGTRGRPHLRKQPAVSAAEAREPRSKQAQAFLRSERNRKIALAVVLLIAIGVVAFFPVALVTDQPSFCPTCHGMKPFYDAWQTGGHKNLWCIDCHVEPGYPNRFAHKFVALQEVYDQLFTHATFPNYNADMPNSRCLRCHQDVPTKIAAVGQFSHQMHLGRGVQCATCHATVGHEVTFAALDSAGVLNANQVTAGNTFVGQQFQGAAGAHSVLPGHRPVPCSNCHDQANLQCSFCHTPPPSHFGADCKLCHNPSVPFQQFTHPPSGEHSYLSRPCAKCHPNGYTTVFCTCHNGHPPTGD